MISPFTEYGEPESEKQGEMPGDAMTWSRGSLMRGWDRLREQVLVPQVDLRVFVTCQAEAVIGHSLPKVPRQSSCEWCGDRRLRSIRRAHCA
jgi:hypothetical protein